jgi:hypothetical protein
MTLQRLRKCGWHFLACTRQEQLGSDIARQRLQLTTRNREAEKVRRNLRQLVRFVDDDGIGAGEQVAEALLLEHQVRHQQMMIHHDDVRRLRFAARLHDVTTIECRAIRAETVVACRGDPRPHGI